MAPWTQSCISSPLLPSTHVPSPLPLLKTGGNTVRVIQEGEWPSSTDVFCWHCCHPFDGPPLPLPTRWDAQRNIFHVMGTFCSWGCMKAYSLQQPRLHCTNEITLFHKACTGKLSSIRSAPPRIILEAFGGHMSIDEFRCCQKELQIRPPKMILHNPVVDDVPPRMNKPTTQATLDEKVSFEDAKFQSEMLRLRRPTPLALEKHNRLIHAMGVST